MTALETAARNFVVSPKAGRHLARHRSTVLMLRGKDAPFSQIQDLLAQHGVPEEMSGQITGVYPWGTQWPPPKGAGNYSGEETKRDHPDWNFITGYNDGYAETSPVGSFNANPYGLYDMGGNVCQWCEDRYEAGRDERVVRGSSYGFSEQQYLISSYRGVNPRDRRVDYDGFRVVVAVAP